VLEVKRERKEYWVAVRATNRKGKLVLLFSPQGSHCKFELIPFPCLGLLPFGLVLQLCSPLFLQRILPLEQSNDLDSMEYVRSKTCWISPMFPDDYCFFLPIDLPAVTDNKLKNDTYGCSLVIFKSRYELLINAT
jgi:hypothetical protein